MVCAGGGLAAGCCPRAHGARHSKKITRAQARIPRAGRIFKWLAFRAWVRKFSRNHPSLQLPKLKPACGDDWAQDSFDCVPRIFKGNKSHLRDSVFNMPLW